MPREIERRFLLKDPLWRPAGTADHITQGYFWPGETATGHIRQLKGPSRSFAFVLKPRDAREWVLPIKPKDAKELLAECPHYLTGKWAMRVRRSSKEGGFFTLKGPSRDEIDRPEYEYGITPRETSWLLNLCKDTHVIKDRYKVRYKGRVWDVDYYLGHLAGQNLASAEIEVPKVTTIFSLPPWVGPEISTLKGLSNAALARRLPLPELPKVQP